MKLLKKIQVAFDDAGFLAEFLEIQSISPEIYEIKYYFNREGDAYPSYSYYKIWEESYDFSESKPSQKVSWDRFVIHNGGNPRYAYFIIGEKLDTARIHRRIEDRLKKSNPEVILRVAYELGVHLT